VTDGIRAGTAYIDFKGDFTGLKKEIGAQLAPLTSRFGKFGVGAAGAVAGVTAAAALASKALYDIGDSFDNAYDTIRINTGKTGKSLDKLKNDFRAVVKTTPTDFATAADAIADLNSRLGETGKPLREVTRNLLELSRMTDTDVQSNIKTVTRLYADWGVQQKQQIPTLNKLWRAHEKTGVTISDLADNMVKFGSPLRQLGFNFNEAAAMFSAFEQQGVNMQTLLPGLRFALKNLSNPTADLTKEFKAWGVNMKDPKQALDDVFALLKKAPTDLKANKIAFEVFGGRAGPDMAAAVREGRFSYKQLLDEIANGRDTVLKASKDTRDFSENWQILKNRVFVFLEPLAKAVFETINKGMAALVNFDLSKTIRQLGITAQDMKALGVVFKATGKVVETIGKLFSDYLVDSVNGFLSVFRGSVKVIRGIVNLIGDLLRLRFKDAWEDVKDIFRGAVDVLVGIVKVAAAPFRGAVRLVAQGLKSAFSDVWGDIKGVFVDGANAVIDVVNKIIDVINVVPGVPNIDHVGNIGSGGNDAPPGDHGGNNGLGRYVAGYFSGGHVTRPTYMVGEEAPRHNEWVIATNPAYRKDNVGYWMQAGKDLGVPGFAAGGKPISAHGHGSFGSSGLSIDIDPSIPSPKDIINKGAQFFIDKLPKPHLPKWLAGLGSYLISKVTDYIKNGFDSKEFGKFTTGQTLGGSLPGTGGSVPGHPELQGGISRIVNAVLQRWGGLSITSTTGGTHATDSLHYQGRAADLASPTDAAGLKYMIDASGWIKQKMGAALAEGIHKPNLSIKDGSGVPASFWGASTWDDHWDHIHLGYAKGGLVDSPLAKAARLAKRLTSASFKTRQQFPYALDEVWPSAKGGTQAWADLPQLPFWAVAALAEHVGLPGKTFAQICEGEGAMRPGSWNIDPNGVTKGYGLWAITSPYNDALVAKYGGYGQMFNPLKNAKAAREIYDSQGIGAWYGTGSVTDTNAHYQGDYNIQNAFSNGGGGSGGGGLTDAQIKRREGKARKANRLAKLKALEALVGKAETPMGRRSALWDVIQFFGRFGLFDQDSRKHTLEAVRRAGSFANPLGGMKVLSGLMSWLDGHVDLSGQEDVEKSIGDAMKNARAAGQAVGSKRRRKVLSRVALQGLDPRHRKIIEALDTRIGRLGEEIDITDRQAQWPGSPSGSDYSDSEIMDLIGTAESPGKYRKLLGLYKRQRDVVVATRENLAEHLEKIQPLIQAATPRDSRTHWRLGALKANRSKTVGLIDSLGTKLVDLQGLTGQGGLIFDTQDTIKTFTGETETPDNSELSDLLLQLLTEANQRYQVSQAQYPILNPPVMHTGGIVPGPQTADVPIIAQGGEGVFTRSQMDAMGGGMAVAVVVEDGAVDQNKIRVVAGEEAERVQRRTARSAGRITPGGGGPWR